MDNYYYFIVKGKFYKIIENEGSSNIWNKYL